jgi:glycosyltransferase involved in cell wall biosynthesis
MKAMRSTPLVSAIIIFLNEERFLSEAIESVLGQSYFNWELLLVDDGSSDASTEIARRCAEQHAPRVRYLEHPGHMNRGMSASRNLGIQQANGEFIALLDADDVWLPNKLERQLAIMEAQIEAAMVYGATELWYGWTGRSEDITRDTKQALGVKPNALVNPPELLKLFLARKAITPCPSDVLVRRETVSAVGGFVDSFPGMYEDQIFFAKVTLKAPVFVSGECWSRHRQHSESSSSVWRKTGQYYSAEPNVAFLEWIKSYLYAQGMEDPTMEKILHERLWRYHHPVLFRMFRKLRHIAGV